MCIRRIYSNYGVYSIVNGANKDDVSPILVRCTGMELKGKCVFNSNKDAFLFG